MTVRAGSLDETQMRNSPRSTSRRRACRCARRFRRAGTSSRAALTRRPKFASSSTPDRSATGPRRRMDTPMHFPSRCRSAAGNFSSIPVLTPIPRSRCGAISAARRRITPCASMRSTSRWRRPRSAGRNARAPDAVCGRRRRGYLRGLARRIHAPRRSGQHRRLVALDKAARRIVIEERWRWARSTRRAFFHFSEHCRVEAAGERFIASQDGQENEISLPRAEGSSARVAGKSRTAARLALARLRCARRGAGHRLAGAALRAGPARSEIAIS